MTGLTYDSGDHLGAADEGQGPGRLRRVRAEQADAAGGEARPSSSASGSRATSRCAAWRRRGCWPRSTTAPAAGSTATVRVLPTNKVQVVSGSTPHGQGHETSWSMIVADKLGVAPEDVEVLHSDTAISPIGLDTYGSRSLAVGGVAIDKALDQIVDKAKADRRPPAGGVRGRPRVRGRHVQRGRHAGARRTPLAAIAFAAFTAHDLPDGMEPNLRGDGQLRPAQLLVALRHAHVRGRGRHRDRRGRGREVRGRRRLRRADQPAHRRRPGPRRRRSRAWPRRCSRRPSTTTDGNLKTSHAGRVPRTGGLRRARRSRPTTPSPRRPRTAWA